MTYTTSHTITATPEFSSEGPHISVSHTITATPGLSSEGPHISVYVSDAITTVSITDDYRNVATMTEQQARNAARQIMDMTDKLRAEGL